MNNEEFLFLKKDGRIYGPFAISRVEKMCRNGALQAQDMISPDKKSWQSAGKIFNIQENSNMKTVVLDTASLRSSTAKTGKETEKKRTPESVQIKKNNTPENIVIAPSPGKTAGLFLAMIFLTFAVFIILYFTCKEHKSEPAENGKTENSEMDISGVSGRKLRDIIRENKSAVGVVIVKITGTDNRIHKIPSGTAWAYERNSFVTNAHVINGIKKIYRNIQNKQQKIQSFEVVVAMNESTVSCNVTGMKIHPQYASDAKGCDFAVMSTDRDSGSYLKCAGKDELYDLQQGDDIFYLGFPMEGLTGKNININNPTAIMQSGTISAVSDTSFGNSSAENNILIRHNLPTVGGASGSPIFSANGKVIAILNAGNMNFKFDKNGRYTGREPSAAQVNFAIRIDRLEACHQVDFISLDEFLRN